MYMKAFDFLATYEYVREQIRKIAVRLCVCVYGECQYAFACTYTSIRACMHAKICIFTF